MSGFYFGGSESSDIDDDNLPYPTPLPRSAFLTPDFSPVVYLSTLHNRHQTLEDLRSELRSRSQQLSGELLDLLNTNYQDFFNIGISLHGGEEKVEEVRVGLLGFKKDLEGVREIISKREKEIRTLLFERRELKKQIWLGRSLLDLAARLEDLEERLMIKPRLRSGSEEGIEWDLSDTDEDSEDDVQTHNPLGTRPISINRLERLVQDFLYVKRNNSRMGPVHPFLAAQALRIQQVRNTLLLDLHAALEQALASRPAGKERLVRVMGLYGDMDEANEALRVLKSNRS